MNAMSRHKNYKRAQTRSAPPLPANDASSEHRRLQEAAIEELVRHGGSETDVKNLRKFFEDANTE
jgi:hypothetical protein